MIELSWITVGEWQMNCYLLSGQDSSLGILIDPGDEAERILEWLGPTRITQILITHGDQDHVGGLNHVREALGAPVGIHPADAEKFGLKPDFSLAGGDALEIATNPLLVSHVPGHTPGSVIFYLPQGAEGPLAVVGDAIFPGGPGRTHSHQDLLTALDGLAHSVFTWPDDTLLYPGHGAATTVGAERGGFEAFCSQPIPGHTFGDVTWDDLS